MAKKAEKGFSTAKTQRSFSIGQDTSEETTSNGVSIKEDNWPEISPYTGPALTFLIGSSRVSYIVLELYARKSPKWTFPSVLSNPFDPCGQTVELPDVDEDIGHTLVHYLYTGNYQTLKPQGVSASPNTKIEYKRGILVYRAAKLYGLDGLAEHAIRNMELFDQGLSIFQILDIARGISPKLIMDEIGLSNYFKAKIETAFETDETIFAQERFLSHIGEATAFNKALVKIMVGIYTDKIASMAKKEVAEESGLPLPPPPEQPEEAPEIYSTPHTPPGLPLEELAAEEPTARELGRHEATTAEGAFGWKGSTPKSSDSDGCWEGFLLLPSKKKDKKGEMGELAVYEDEAAHDDAWSFPSTKDKKEKASLFKDPVPDTTPGLVVDTKQEDDFGWSFGSSKDKKKKTEIVEKTPTKPFIVPEPVPVKEEDPWSFTSVATTKKGKKGKKTIAVVEEKPAGEIPLPPPPEPIAPPPADDWGSFATTVGTKGKKGKKGKAEPIKAADLVPDPVVEPEPELVPEPATKELDPEPVADDWGSTWGSVGKKDKKKTGKKGTKVEEIKEEPTLEPPPEPTPVEPAATEDLWGGDDAWGTAATTVPTVVKGKKKAGKKAISKEEPKKVEDPPKEPDSPVIPEPPPAPDDWADIRGFWGVPAVGKKKKGKNAKLEPPPPGPAPVDDTIMTPDAVDELKAPEEDDWATPSWGKKGVKKSISKKDTPVEVTDDIVAPVQEPALCEGSCPVDAAVPSLVPGIEQSVCPVRAQHILDGDSWKSCKKCRAIIRQVSIQLAHEGNIDTEQVDEILLC